MPQFKPLTREDIVKLAGSVEVREYNNNEVLAKQNQTKIDHIYVILRGHLSLFHDKQGQRSLIGYIKKGSPERYYENGDQKTMIGLLSEGDIFGGISVLSNEGISLRTLQVKEDSDFYILPKQIYLDLCSRYEIFSGCLRQADDHSIVCRAIMPIVDFARVYALKHRIEETNTWERIYKLRVKQVVSQQESDDLEKAYSFLMQMRFVQQAIAAIYMKFW